MPKKIYFNIFEIKKIRIRMKHFILLSLLLVSLLSCKNNNSAVKKEGEANQLTVSNNPEDIKHFGDQKTKSEAGFKSVFQNGGLPMMLSGEVISKEFGTFTSISPSDFRTVMGPTEVVIGENKDSYKAIVNLPKIKGHDVKIYAKSSEQGKFAYAGTFNAEGKLIGVLALAGKVTNGSNVVVDCKVDNDYNFFVRSMVGKMYHIDKFNIDDQGIFIKTTKPEESYNF